MPRPDEGAVRMRGAQAQMALKKTQGEPSSAGPGEGYFTANTPMGARTHHQQLTSMLESRRSFRPFSTLLCRGGTLRRSEDCLRFAKQESPRGLCEARHKGTPMNPSTPIPKKLLPRFNRLRSALDTQVPCKRLDRNLLVATWNIRHFGGLTEKWTSKKGDSPRRDLFSVRCIADLCLLRTSSFPQQGDSGTACRGTIIMIPPLRHQLKFQNSLPARLCRPVLKYRMSSYIEWYCRKPTLALTCPPPLQSPHVQNRLRSPRQARLH